MKHKSRKGASKTRSHLRTSERCAFYLVMLAAICLALNSSAQASEFEGLRKAGDITYRLVLETDPAAASNSDPPHIRLSGEDLTVEICGPISLEVMPPESVVQATGCAVNRIKPDEWSTLSDGRRCWRRFSRLEPERPGPITIQLAEFHARTANGPKGFAPLKVPLMVVTSIHNPGPDQLIEDLALEPYDLRSEFNLYLPAWIALVSLVLGFFALGFIRFRLAQRYRQESAADWLRRRLTELRSRDLHEPVQIARFYSDLADLFRQFAERQFAFPAPAQTTREFLGDLQTSTSLDANRRELLERFLVRCDLVKFARQAPTPADCDAAVDLVLRFVDEGIAKKEPGYLRKDRFRKSHLPREAD